MNGAEVESFVIQYLHSTKSQLIEKGKGYATFKLSPQADKELSQRTYYWSFVERTGVEPETLTYCFVFDPLNNELTSSNNEGQSLIRNQRYETPFGSSKLEQIFQAVRSRGRWVCLFEESLITHYKTWLAINFKIEWVCDMKRSEIYSLGISLTDGQISENFQESLVGKKLTARIPLNTLLQQKQLSVTEASNLAEQHLAAMISRFDHAWAIEARERLSAETSKTQTYYEQLLQSIEPNLKQEVEQQFIKRQQELDWQYQPKINVSVINSGLFHLNEIST